MREGMMGEAGEVWKAPSTSGKSIDTTRGQAEMEPPDGGVMSEEI